uniref:Uncharacterized protein n=1 Tax=Anguilla anguilla TaxID=7936 RepID=A0A0E9P5D3_ANGAN
MPQYTPDRSVQRESQAKIVRRATSMH